MKTRKTTYPQVLFAMGLLFGLPLCVQAQQYSINWSSADGGGGMSTGGVYSVSGTFGQPDARAMSGGPYSLKGGFWSGIDASESPIKPSDLLTTSATPGHCMKAIDSIKSQGATLGKAMSALEKGEGMVLVSSH